MCTRCVLPCDKIKTGLQENEPIDLPEGEEKKDNLSTLLHLIATSSLVIGLLFYLMHWPYGPLLLVIGIGIYAAWNLYDLTRFRQKKHWELAYGLGRLLLIAALYSGIVKGKTFSVWLFSLAAVCFIVGIVMSLRQGRD